MWDEQHQHTRRRGQCVELEHHYGDQVHLLADPTARTLLAHLCSPSTHQPRINQLVEALYRQLVIHVVNQELPTTRARFDSRMKGPLEHDGHDPERGVIETDVLDPNTPVVTVDIARAGILPSLTCYNTLNGLLDPASVRQDHLIMSRAVDADDHVVGARISGDKIGGPIEGRYVLLPDPMGATGSSLSTAVQYYKDTFGGQAARWITLNLIITPEFIRRIVNDHPDVVIYALRLDRGMSDPDVLATAPGTHWERESGLNEHDYIVPGGGGFGEIMNNAWI
ncbi:MAG: uracil phosphoribosyltransferase [Myxococcota bacterium]